MLRLNQFPDCYFSPYLNSQSRVATSSCLCMNFQTIAHNQSKSSKYFFLMDSKPIPELAPLHLFLSPLSIASVNSSRVTQSFFSKPTVYNSPFNPRMVGMFAFSMQAGSWWFKMQTPGPGPFPWLSCGLINPFF